MERSNEIRDVVRENYSKIAEDGAIYSGCGCGPEEDTSCCGPTQTKTFTRISSSLGYSNKEMDNVPDGANLGLGCRNPQAIAGLKEGEIVLDLGSGAGFDVFLAANQVGHKGKVIGVDMTPKMITKVWGKIGNI